MIKIQQVVLPVYGKGLWGTLWGYLAIKKRLENDPGDHLLRTQGNARAGWRGRQPSLESAVDRAASYSMTRTVIPAALVFKGPAPATNPYAVDGLSGATITSRGVTNLVRYWVSDDGYGPLPGETGSKSGVNE